MNIRFSPSDVRLRVSLEEAQQLAREGRLDQEIALEDWPLKLEIRLSDEQESVAQFMFNGTLARASLRRAEFIELLSEKPSRESRIQSALNSQSSLTFIFEVDLFSRKSGAKERE